jgi:hypothetical protein
MPERDKNQRMADYSESQAVKELEAETPHRDKSASESLQETKQVKKRLKKTLRAKHEVEEWDEDKGEYITSLEDIEGVDPLISKEGLEHIWSIIEPIVSETAAGSNLSQKDVAHEGFDAIKTVIGNVMVKHDEWEIPDPESADLIISACNAAMKNNLKKAEGGALLDFHKESRSVKEFISRGDDDSSGSGWNPFS